MHIKYSQSLLDAIYLWGVKKGSCDVAAASSLYGCQRSSFSALKSNLFGCLKWWEYGGGGSISSCSSVDSGGSGDGEVLRMSLQ